MNKRRWAWLAVALVVVALVVVLVPGTPLYFENWSRAWGWTSGGNVGSGGWFDGQPTRYWMNSLDDSNPEVRRKALFALGSIGADGARESVPALTRVLREDRSRENRIEASLALSKLAPAAPDAVREAVPALAQALEDEEPFVRMNAATALFQLRTEARPAVPALIQALNKTNNRTNLKAFHFTVQERVALALGRASAGTADGVPALREALEAADGDELREFTARALGEVGPEARPAVPQLKALLKSKSPGVREACKLALEKIDPKQADGK